MSRSSKASCWPRRAGRHRRKLAFEKAVTHQKRALSLSDGKSSAYGELLPYLRLLADVCLVLGDYDDALHAAVDLPKYAPQQGQGYFNAARILAQCVSQAQSDPTMVARRDEIAQKVPRPHRRDAS